MKASVTFKEVTTKTIEIEGDDLEKIREKADYYATEDVSVIDFEKNPTSYEVEIINIKENKEAEQ